MTTRRRGFALYTTVMIGMLIAGVLSALTLSLASDYRRTKRLEEDTQFTQVMLASLRISESRLADGSLHMGETTTITPPIEGASIVLKPTLLSDQLAEITATAQLGEHKQNQQLRIEHTTGTWKTVSAELSQNP